MALQNPSSPHIHSGITVTTVMVRVLLALIPGIAIYAWFFGPGILINIAFATGIALLLEALVLTLRGRPPGPSLRDGSAVVTAVLLAIALPPLSPWWLTLTGIAFAIIIGKHLFGGLGYNPFNPAMLGYVMLLISFPRNMTLWQPPAMLSAHALGFMDTVRVIFTGHLPGGLTIDAFSSATPLDTLKTQLRLERGVAETMASSPVFGVLGGKGWEWANLALLAGGLWMLYKRVIGWQIPVGLLGALALISGLFFLIEPKTHATPLFHLFSGASILGAFFIATDPITASTTPRGRLVYGAGIGILTYIIRTWGGYPDGIAFSVLLMNLAAPTIDHYTQPRVFGHQKKKE